MMTLQEQVSKIEAGDKVTARFVVDGDEYTITGKARSSGKSLWLTWHLLRNAVGQPIGRYLLAIEKHEPALPPEPQGDVIVVSGGAPYFPYGTCLTRPRWRLAYTSALASWAEIAPGAKVYRRES